MLLTLLLLTVFFSTIVAWSVFLLGSSLASYRTPPESNPSTTTPSIFSDCINIDQNHRSLRAPYFDPKTVVLRQPDPLFVEPKANLDDTKPLQFAPYSIEDLVELSSIFMNTFGILVYDPEGDEFLLLYNDKRHNWSHSCAKLVWSFQIFANMLRKGFPERFRGRESPELVIAIGSGDYPHLQKSCYQNFPHVSPECSAKIAPILQFGSVYRHADMLPNMIAMPTPPHMGCLLNWLTSRKYCELQPSGSQPSGQYSELKFEDLIPQVVWRGKDFGYLHHHNHALRRPYINQDIESNINPVMDKEEVKTATVSAVAQLYDILLPRWKGVVLTVEAELEAERMKEGDVSDTSLPWANIKFSRGTPSIYPTYFSDLAKFGIDALGDYMYITDLSRYKYQIDLGGGGGTTWSGTMQKLAMPGLLFHHLTPTKDYFHDWMQPWIHYVPVAEDLHDLREKFDWAEANPQAAKMISENGTEFMRHLGTPEGLDELSQQAFAEPVRRMIEAYLPVSISHPGLTWKEVLTNLEGDSWVTKRRCGGWFVNLCSSG